MVVDLYHTLSLISMTLRSRPKPIFLLIVIQLHLVLRDGSCPMIRVDDETVVGTVKRHLARFSISNPIL